MTLLVTGGGGFVGAYVVRRLLGQGAARIVVLDAASSSATLDRVLPSWRDDERVVLRRGSITAPLDLVRAAREHDVEAIVHLASPLTNDAQEHLRGAVETICIGTANVLETAAVLGLRKVVWTSSISVFGAAASHGPGPISADACHRPNSLYGACKSLTEHLASQYRTERGVDSVGLRLTIVYGPGRARGITSFISEVVERAAAGQPVTIEHADQQLNWQFVEDVADVIALAVDAPQLPRTTYNTTGDPRSIREAADVLQGLVPGCEVQLTPGTFDEPGGLLDFPAEFDDSDLRRDLGFSSAYALERGLAASVAATGARGTADGAAVLAASVAATSPRKGLA